MLNKVNNQSYQNISKEYDNLEILWNCKTLTYDLIPVRRPGLVLI